MNITVKKILKWSGISLVITAVLIVLYLGQFFAFPLEPKTQASDFKNVDELDSYLSALVEEGLPPALDVTVLKGGQPIFSKAYGVANGLTGEKASKDHVYHYWSMTKSFTAVAIFQLVEQGKISLEQSITHYLPQFSPIDEAGNPVTVTIKQLLSHTSGVPDLTMNMVKWVHLEGEPRYGDTRMVNERLPQYQTVVAKPGTVSEYSNNNFILLGALIEAITEQSYEDYIRQAILVPLKMDKTDFTYHTDNDVKIAKGSHYYYQFFTPIMQHMGMKGGLNAQTDGEIGDRLWLKEMHSDYNASTALVGTGIDMSRFGQMLLNGGILDGTRILSQENANKMMFEGRFANEKQQVADGIKELALGYGIKTWYDKGIEIIGHGGGGPGFALQYFVVPEKDLVVVILTNQTAGAAFDIGRSVVSVF